MGIPDLDIMKASNGYIVTYSVWSEESELWEPEQLVFATIESVFRYMRKHFGESDDELEEIKHD